MGGRNDKLMGLVLTLTLLGRPLAVQAAERRAMHAGDVTMTATSEQDATCEECPGGTGTKICYDVVLDADAQHEDARDFHIKVSDGNANHYQCPEVCEVVIADDGTETCEARDDDEDFPWANFGYGSQLEGNPPVRQHYIGWWRGNDGLEDDHEQRFDSGEIWRFCFVYCGPDTNLDNTIEWILTNLTDDATPGVPDENGNRSDVPDDEGLGGDDPGWSGTKSAAPGSKVGFSLAGCILPDGSCRDDVADFECTDSGGEPLGDGSVCGASECPADLDGNNLVDAADLAMLLGAWGECIDPDPIFGCPQDLNHDGIINAADLAHLLGNWGECPQPAACGDGVIGAGEQCDPPDGELCDESCQLIDPDCPFPDIRAIVSDADFDPPHVQRNYDAINRTLHLFGDVTFEDFFFSSFELLVPDMLERLETLDTCTGNPSETADLAAALQLIADLAGDLTPAEVISSSVGEMGEIKAAIDGLRIYGIAFPPMAATDADAGPIMLSIEMLTLEAGLLNYADLFFLPYDQISDAQLGAVMQANQPNGVLDYQAIDVNGDVHAVIPNDRCCKKKACEPDLLDLDECHAEESKACYIPGSSDNCGICSVGSKDCS